MAGTGRTCTTCLLLGKTPPKEHNSTGVKDSVRRVRNVRNFEYQASDNEWKEVTLHDLEKIIVEKMSYFSKEESKKEPSTHVPTDALKQKEGTEEIQQIKTDPEIVKKVKDEVQTLQNILISDINLRTKQIFGSNWIYVIDSGGQPHFHNLLPLFINGISIAIYVFRLSDKLSDCPLIKYARKGKQESELIRSNLSVLENFKYLNQSIHSHNGKCRVLCVGTHLDEYEKLVTREVIDEKKNLLKQDIITIDTQTEGEERKRQVQAIRDEVNEADSEKIKIPTWWHLLEIRIRKKDKKIISFSECKEIADELNFHPNALVAALKFFHEHHIFHYYHEVLPNVIFCSTQVLLDIVSELIEQAVYIQSMRTKPSKQDNLFKSFGIITPHFLKKMFEKIFFARIIPSRAPFKDF